ncbi:MAG: hypothetical protein OXT67_11535 [Zetaproteobacteria bacterium]|nr:hypothetical protein [Zetaproteobacteria bacterium]
MFVSQRVVSKWSVQVKAIQWLVSVTAIVLLGACGSDEDSSTSETSTSYTWSGDIAPIIASSCAAGGSCHESSNSSLTTYVGNESNVVSNKTAVSNRIQGIGSIMPPTSSSATLSTADRDKIISFLNQ